MAEEKAERSRRPIGIGGKLDTHSKPKGGFTTGIIRFSGITDKVYQAQSGVIRPPPGPYHGRWEERGVVPSCSHATQIPVLPWAEIVGRRQYRPMEIGPQPACLSGWVSSWEHCAMISLARLR